MKCPHCQSEKTVSNRKARLKDQRPRPNYIGRNCGARFNERTKTPMARWRTAPEIVSAALSVRSEGLGSKAARMRLARSGERSVPKELRFLAARRHKSASSLVPQACECKLSRVSDALRYALWTMGATRKRLTVRRTALVGGRISAQCRSPNGQMAESHRATAPRCA